MKYALLLIVLTFVFSLNAQNAFDNGNSLFIGGEAGVALSYRFNDVYFYPGVTTKYQTQRKRWSFDSGLRVQNRGNYREKRPSIILPIDANFGFLYGGVLGIYATAGIAVEYELQEFAINASNRLGGKICISKNEQSIFTLQIINTRRFFKDSYLGPSTSSINPYNLRTVEFGLSYVKRINIKSL